MSSVSWKQLRALLELRLTALALLLLGDDVDVEPGELGGQPHVLAAPADGEAELLLGHDDLDPLGLVVEHDLRDLGGLERVDEERRRVVVPGDDVDALALELVDDGLDAAPAHADAGADRVDARVVGDDGDLRPAAGIAGAGLDLDHAVVDLRHLHLEELLHELGRGAREEDLRPLRLAAHVLDVDADAVARPVALAADLLVAAQHRLARADVDDNVAVLLALHEAVDDRAGAILELLVLALALGLAHLLEDHLLGGLRGDAAHVDGRHLVDDRVAELRVCEVLPGLIDGKLGLLVLDQVCLDDRADAGEGRLPGLAVDGHADVHLAAVARLRRAREALLHRLDHEARLDHLLARDRVGDLEKLQLVGCGDGHTSRPLHPSSLGPRRTEPRRSGPHPCARAASRGPARRSGSAWRPPAGRRSGRS